MAEYTEIYVKRDSTLNWYAANPRLGLGEPGVDMTLHRFKIGNGIDRWNELPYMDDDLYKLLDKQSQEAADKAKELLTLINANKLDADTKHNAVTTELRNTSRELDRRMTAVETEQAEYEEALTAEFEDTKAEVHSGLEEFSETRDQLSTRMDVIAGQATEDAEILDARVDADYETHPNLGANIRNIHTKLKEAVQVSAENKSEINEEIAALKSADDTERLSRIEADDIEKAERIAGYEEHTSDILRLSDAAKKLNTYDEHLQEQIDKNAEGLLRMQLLVHEEIENARSEEKRLDDEQAAREEKDEELEEAIEAEGLAREHADNELDEYIRDVDSALTESLEQEVRIRKQSDDELAESLGHEAERITQAEADIQAQTEEILTEREERIQSSNELAQAIYKNTAKTREKVLASTEHLQEQIDLTANELLRANLERLRKTQALDEEDQRLHEEIAGTEQRLHEEAVNTVSAIRQELQNSVSGLGHNLTSRDEHLQEQINQNAQVSLQQLLNFEDEIEKRRELENVVAGIKSPIDWSSAESLAIPEPRCAVVNFSGLASMPTSKTVDIPAVLEFWDMQGNYFKKPVSCAAQGSSSMGFIKKNVKFDLLNDDGSEFDLKIGDWVVQDGFHLKAYYTDFFRGVGVTSYKLWDEIMQTKPYKRALVNVEGMNPTATGVGNVSDLTLQIDTGALCHPDGFPCIVYLNGKFYGVFSWQIKKQRKNYHMDKSTVEHIHLDGTLGTANFWNGTINWTAFEIRNPNKLYTMDGKKYDGDAPRELIDETSEKYDPDNKDHVRSAKVKKYIQGFVQSFGVLKNLYAAYRASPGDEMLAAVKAKYEELFDWENQRDYLIFSDVIKNSDGYAKNWQWTTYDGLKWYVNAYDLDMSYGGDWQGRYITAPLTGHITTSTALPVYYVALLYKSELEARYRKLREAGIIDVEHIVAKLADWTARIGESNYELEYERWPNSPCLLNYNDSVDRVRKWLTVEIANMDKVYGYEHVTLEGTAKDIRREHDADVQRLEASDKVLAKIRYDSDAGLQEQINELAGLALRDVLRRYDEQKVLKAEKEQETAQRQNERQHDLSQSLENDQHLQEQANKLSEAVLRVVIMLYSALVKIGARFSIIEEALVDGGLLDESDIPPATEQEIMNMIDDIFSGNSPGDEETPDDTDDDEIEEMLDEVFGA